MTVLKIVSGALIIAASVFLGNRISVYYKNKKRFLEETCDFIGYVRSEIDFYNREIDEIIRDYSAKNPKSDLTVFLREEKQPKNYETMLAEYIEGVKRLDKSSQKDFSASFSEKLKREIEKNEKDLKIKVDTIKKIAPLTGIAVFILLL